MKVRQNCACGNEKLESYYIVNQEMRIGIYIYIYVCFEGLIFCKVKTYVHSSELSNQSVDPFLRFKIVTMVKIAGSGMNERTNGFSLSKNRIF